MRALRFVRRLLPRRKPRTVSIYVNHVTKDPERTAREIAKRLGGSYPE